MLNVYVIRFILKFEHFKKQLSLQNLRQRIQIWITSQFEQLSKTLHSNNFLLRTIFKCEHFQKLNLLDFKNMMNIST